MKIVAAITIAYAFLGLVVVAPDAVYSGDIGVKFVQARALAANHFTSLDIPYPGHFLDPAREFFPIRPPFVMQVGTASQAIFSPASAVLQAGMAAIGGLRGMVLSSIISAAIILVAAMRMAPSDLRVPVVLALGIASPLWFYAVTGWEHAPAVALSTAGFAVAVRAEQRGWPLLAGLLVGAGASVRDEVILLFPGLLLVTWFRTRTLRPIVLVIAGALVALAGAAFLEVVWFGRPLASHLRHAVHLLQSAAHVATAPNSEFMTLAPMTLRERYETVIWYWLVGYGNDVWILLFAGALAAALLARWRLRTSVPLLCWTVAVMAVALDEACRIIFAPRFLAGLHRVSPYLIFALLPAPLSGKRVGWLQPAVLLTALLYVALAFAGVDTTGGKALGPRLLLPLLPMLTVVAVSCVAAYLRATTRSEQAIGAVGATIVVCTMGLHAWGTPRAYLERNRVDAAAVLHVKTSTERVIVATDEITAQLLLPLYYRKIIFLADTPQQGSRLVEKLEAAKVADVLMFSHDLAPIVNLAPRRLMRIEKVGRFSIRHWSR